MKEIVIYSDVPYLPEEMITNILKRLPSKLLSRFQCVCKAWKNLLETPYFIAEQVHHFTQQNPCLVFKRGGNKRNPGELCLVSPDSQFLQQQIPISTDSSMGSCRFVHPSNGYLCLEFMKSKSLFLWNPATREVYQVPKSLSVRGEGLSCVGFGFNPIVNDYKIVRFFISVDLNDDDCAHTVVEVFSLRKRQWKEVEVGELKGIIPIGRPCGFTFNGVIYWFGFTREGPLLIVSFDIAREDFTLIPFPGFAAKSNDNRLTMYDNKLVMLCRRTGYDNNGRWTSIDLWVMEPKEEGWIWNKIYTGNKHPSLLYPVTIWRNEIVCIVNSVRTIIRRAKVVIEHNETLVLCNLHTNEFKRFDMVKCPINSPIWNYA